MEANGPFYPVDNDSIAGVSPTDKSMSESSDNRGDPIDGPWFAEDTHDYAESNSTSYFNTDIKYWMMLRSPKKSLVSIQSHREPPMVLFYCSLFSDKYLAGASERDVPAMDGGGGVVLGDLFQQTSYLRRPSMSQSPARSCGDPGSDQRRYIGTPIIWWWWWCRTWRFFPFYQQNILPSTSIHVSVSSKRTAPCPNFHLPKSRPGRIQIKMRKQGNNNGVSSGYAAVAVMRSSCLAGQMCWAYLVVDRCTCRGCTRRKMWDGHDQGKWIRIFFSGPDDRIVGDLLYRTPSDDILVFLFPPASPGYFSASHGPTHGPTVLVGHLITGPDDRIVGDLLPWPLSFRRYIRIWGTGGKSLHTLIRKDSNSRIHSIAAVDCPDSHSVRVSGHWTRR